MQFLSIILLYKTLYFCYNNILRTNGKGHIMAKLFFRYGAMNSGKSTSLMQVAYNYEERGMKVKVFKPNIDSKAGDKVSSRLGVTRKVDYLIKENDDIYTYVKGILENEKINCILVDEVQFLKAHHIDELLKVAVILDVPVICYGLRTDFSMNGFEGSERLLLLSHSIEELKTICKCGRKAIVNGRKVNGEYVFYGAQIEIDNQQSIEYEGLCAQCYFKYKDEYEKKHMIK